MKKQLLRHYFTKLILIHLPGTLQVVEHSVHGVQGLNLQSVGTYWEQFFFCDSDSSHEPLHVFSLVISLYRVVSPSPQDVEQANQIDHCPTTQFLSSMTLQQRVARRSGHPLPQQDCRWMTLLSRDSEPGWENSRLTIRGDPKTVRYKYFGRELSCNHNYRLFWKIKGSLPDLRLSPFQIAAA